MVGDREVAVHFTSVTTHGEKEIEDSGKNLAGNLILTTVILRFIFSDTVFSSRSLVPL